MKTFQVNIVIFCVNMHTVQQGITSLSSDWNMTAKLNSKTYFKHFFLFFELFRARMASNFVISAKNDLKTFLSHLI